MEDGSGLQKFEIYKARFTPEDVYGDPIVSVEGPSGIFDARMVRSTNKHWGDAANCVRDRVMMLKEDTGDFYVKVIGTPDFPGQLYAVIGTTRKPSLPRSEFEMTPDEAKDVLLGQSISFARCLFRSQKGGLGIRAYEFGGVFSEPAKKFGFLRPADRRGFFSEKERNFAEAIITSELIEGRDEVSPLSPGDYLIVRKVASNPKGNVWFFEPAVNIRFDDNAKTPEGNNLETRVSDYNPGGLIQNLPITSVVKSIKNGDLLGAGHVQRPEGEKEVHFFYKPVLVIGAAEDKGRYIRAAEIIANNKIILARKLE